MGWKTTSWLLLVWHTPIYFSTKRHPNVQINSNLKINGARMQHVLLRNVHTQLYDDMLPCFLNGPSSKPHLLVFASETKTWPEMADKWLMALCWQWQTESSRKPATASIAGIDGFHRETMCKSDGSFRRKHKRKEHSLGWWLMTSAIRVGSNGCQC